MPTAEEIKSHINNLIAARIPTQDRAHEQFNLGVKFATDYVLEYINIQRPPVKPMGFLRKLARIFWNDEI